MKSSRREFLKTVVVSAGAASIGGSLLEACAGPPPRPQMDVFPQSVASGDPRPDSIVLWTRALPADETLDGQVQLQLATDTAFSAPVTLSSAMFAVAAAHDHCVRVRVTNLSAASYYYYRFVFEGTTSRVGRFRTAPTAATDAPLRFAFTSCQDYVGRYYNSYLKLLEPAQDDLAFVLHLGDYIYETTGDPAFMMTTSTRKVTLRAPDEAIPFTTSEGTFYAARSVSNYRDMYRTYRSDPVLQQVHEKFAFIATWDDHEFSDDCWGDVGTYTDGVKDETDMERRVNSEQVYFEYMPLAMDTETTGELELGRDQLYPNTKLYRSFRFGQHAHLAVTDYRSFRPDHPTPEAAFPGTVVMDQAAVRATLARLQTDGDLPAGPTVDMLFAMGGFRSYVDLSAAAFTDHKQALTLLITAAYQADGVEATRAQMLAMDAVSGKMDAAIAQSTITMGRSSLPTALQGVAAIDPTDPTLEKGLPYLLTGKSTLTGSLGSRYLVIARTYDLVQAWRTRVQNDTTHDNAFGDTQEAWLSQVVLTDNADATWHLIGNSVTSTSLILDLSPFAASLPPTLPPERYKLTVDDWDGFPERRRKLMQEIYQPAEAIILAGDIHSGYATDYGADASGRRVIELTGQAISSGTFRALLYGTGSRVPAIANSGLLDPVLDGLPGFLPTAFPAIKFAHTDDHGIILVSLTATQMQADYYFLAADVTDTSHYDNPGDLPWRHATAVCNKEGGHNSALVVVDPAP